jgi:hypothetical protein
MLPGPLTVKTGVAVAVGTRVGVTVGVNVNVDVGEGVNVVVAVGVTVGVGVWVAKKNIRSGAEQPVSRKKTIKAGKIRFMDSFQIRVKITA